ncbi:putative mucin-like glycoprotein [Trypanosoma theileri]|uniref:Putative mucin-like glycoprotein n=1 Tax=Trypanosoma theileri TaxID=67003 RepID=A0A1X0NYS8_9TRYP|nr:putative mucin-like glycoprotein [Trypanosoma theileri]ORC89623.1 putative mucin-like glycoprotein [Trypanosoma theileri]
MMADKISQFLTANMTEATQISLKEWGPKVISFVQRIIQSQEKQCNGVALVTSGGTVVPLEVHAVRYLTNFSSGGRGANFVESLVQRKWACVFLHHKDSEQPFRCHINRMSTKQLFAELAAPSRSPTLTAAMEAYEKYNDYILYIPYHTVIEYMYLLQLLTVTLSRQVECLQSVPMMLIAAAAVSDYFIPLERMSKNKISGGNGLTLQLDNVPKVLATISEEWHGSAVDIPRYLITFKLETEETAMKTKAVHNLNQYDCDVVVANMLQNYREKVLVYWGGRHREKEPMPLVKPQNSTMETLLTNVFLQQIEIDMHEMAEKKQEKDC